MNRLPKCIILETPLSDEKQLAGFVERCLKDDVSLIAITGADAVKIEDDIDCLVVGDGTDNSRFLTTAAFVDEPPREIELIAKNWADGDGNFLRVQL